ncbi:MAG: hypothetical protein OXG60_04685 [Chloroflexi bacterium]|nr:hypothetical protein [Chloroflexota bacterium]
MQNMHNLYERIEALERRVDSTIKDVVREVIQQELKPIKEAQDEHTKCLASIETTLDDHTAKLDRLIELSDSDSVYLTGGKVRN